MPKKSPDKAILEIEYTPGYEKRIVEAVYAAFVKHKEKEIQEEAG